MEDLNAVQNDKRAIRTSILKKKRVSVLLYDFVMLKE